MPEATFKIITGRVGEGAIANGGAFADVRRIQQLLALIGYNVGPAANYGKWNSSTQSALLHFQSKWVEGNTAPLNCSEAAKIDAAAYASRESGAGSLPIRPYIVPGDRVLFALASAADILIPLPYTKRGAAAFLELHNYLEKRPTPYGGFGKSLEKYPAHWVRGLDGYPGWAIETGPEKYGNQILTCGLALNCTSYPNLMISVWQSGNCHAAPYDPFLGLGGTGTHLSSKYGYMHVKTFRNGKVTSYFKNYDEVRKVVGEFGRYRLFSLEIASDFLNEKTHEMMHGFVHHYTLLYNGVIYQAASLEPNNRVISTPADEWFKSWGHNMVYMFGPADFVLCSKSAA